MSENEATTNPRRWVPEICYEDTSDGITSHIPFIDVPQGLKMPNVIFIFETRNTGEFEPGPDGEPMPIVDLDLHQYADMNILRDKLHSADYDRVRQALGLEPLASAHQKGMEVTDNIRKNIEPISGLKDPTGRPTTREWETVEFGPGAVAKPKST